MSMAVYPLSSVNSATFLTSLLFTDTIKWTLEGSIFGNQNKVLKEKK